MGGPGFNELLLIIVLCLILLGKEKTAANYGKQLGKFFKQVKESLTEITELEDNIKVSDDKKVKPKK